MNRLRLTVQLGAGETQTSFCSRLAARNGCNSAVEFCREMGLSFRDIINGTTATLTKLAHLGGVPFETLWTSALRKMDSNFVCRDQTIARWMLRRNRLVVCPACVIEDLEQAPELGSAAAYRRTAWLLTSVRACPYHARPLVDLTEAEDSASKGTLAINDFAKRIGEVLDRRGSQFARFPPGMPTAFEAYLHQRLEGRIDGSTAWLNSLPFHAAAKACEMVGAVAAFGPSVTARLMTEDKWRTAGAAGFSILAAGQDAFRNMVDSLFHESNRGYERAGLRTYLGQLHRWLSDARAEEYEPFRDIVREVVIDKLAMSSKDCIFEKPVGPHRLYSVHSAALEFEIHPKRLRKLLTIAGFLDAADAGRTNDKAVFLADSRATAFLAKVRDSISLAAVSEYINAPRVQTNLLYRTGIIVPFARSGSHALLTFAKQDLDDFLGRLNADAIEAESGAHDLRNIPEAAKHARCSFITIVQMLLDRRLSRVRCRPGAIGFMALLVDPTEVRSKMGVSERPGLSISEVGRRTKWSRLVVDALICGGHLPARSIFNPVTRKSQIIIQQEDIERFDACYVSLHDVAKARGAHFLKLKAEIEAIGIRPAFDNVRRIFYRRSDLPP